MTQEFNEYDPLTTLGLSGQVIYVKITYMSVRRGTKRSHVSASLRGYSDEFIVTLKRVVFEGVKVIL
jgi:hypothetical protein